MKRSTDKDRPMTVRIFYKSGNSIDFRCKSLHVKWALSGGRVTEMSWDSAVPSPTMVGLDNIEAIWTIGDDTA